MANNITLSAEQLRVLQILASGNQLQTGGGCVDYAYWRKSTSKHAPTLATVNALRKRDLIADHARQTYGCRYLITDAGRSALQSDKD